MTAASCPVPAGTAGARRVAVAVVVALTVALALVTALLSPAHAEASSPGAALPARTATEVSISTDVVRLLNRERAAHHLAPVSMRARLITSARGHDVTMARANTMSHQLPGEPALGSRLTAAGYTWSWAGENIGWNSDMTAAGVLLLQREMYDEVPPDDGHRLNILNPHFTDVGVDVYLDAAHHKVWLTVDFGRH